LTRLLLDQGLPYSTAGRLQQSGWDVTHACDAQLSRASDERILSYARREQRVVVTLDADFHALLAVTDADSPSVIRIRREGLPGAELAALLQRIWPQIEESARKGAMITVTEKAVRIHRLPASPKG